MHNFLSTETEAKANQRPASHRDKLRKSSLFVIAAALIASKAQAQTSQRDTSEQVALNSIDGVADVEQMADGSVKVTLDNGETITLPADQVSIVDGEVFVSDATLQAAGLDEAGSFFSSDLFTPTNLAIAGGVAAAAIGIGVGVSGGGDNNDAPAPVNTAPQFTSSSSVNFAENSTDAVITATATDADGDTVTFSIVGGNDAGLFEIDSATGELTFTGSPDFENPTDADGNNTFDVNIQASDGTNTTTQTVTVTVTNVNDNTPEFTSDPTATVAENSTETGFVASATDLDGDTVTFSITGGADAALFVIDPDTGELSFVNAPDFENPADADGDNVFDVVVTASDGENTVDQTVTLTVTDSVEASSIFIGASGSSFLDAANFQDGNLPDAQDEVLIDLGPTDEVLFENGSLEIAGLTSNADFRLNSGTLTAGFINLGEGADLFLAGGNLINAIVDGNVIFDAEGTPPSLSSDLVGVTLNGDLDFTNVSGTGNRIIEVEGGLTVNGELSIIGAGDGTADATIFLTESQTIDGTGTILLGDARADHKDDAASNIFVAGSGTIDIVFGEDITIAGSGSVDANFNGSIQILGNVVATGGNFLELSNIDNLGESFTINATDGSIGLSQSIDNAIINGEGIIELLSSLDITNTTFNVGARVDGAHGNVSIELFNGLTLNNTLELIDTEAADAVRFDVNGTQTIDGTGEILLSRGDTPIGERSDNQINFIGQNGGDPEVLTFGEDITIRGDGAIDGSTFANNDTVQILGTVAGIENGFLSISELDNQGENITIEQSAGIVAFEGNVRNTIFDGDGLIDFIGGTVNFENLVLNTDARVGGIGIPGQTIINLADNLTINGDFSLLDENAASGSELRIETETSTDVEINGTGRIILGDTQNNNFDTLFTFDDTQIIFFGADGRGTTANNTVEALIIGEDIDIEGSGFVTANGLFAFGDTIQILGSVTGIEEGRLVLQNLDNEGASLTVDASARDGSVVIAALASDTVFDVIDGALEFNIGTFNDITINGDAFIAAGIPLVFENGLELNGTLDHTSSSSVGPPVRFEDSQTITGDGEIILSITDTTTPLRFAAGDDNLGFFNTDIDAGRSLITIDQDVTISGTGALFVGAGTTLDIDGTIRSDDLIIISHSFDDPDSSDSARISNIDFTDATFGGGFGTIDFDSQFVNSTFSFDAEGIAFTDTTTFEVALDGATGQHSDFLFGLADLANAAVELNVTNGDALTLGQRFTVFDERLSNDGLDSQIADQLTFSGDFGSFINFDLEGDFAFILEEAFTPIDNGVDTILVRSFDLVVVTDQEAIDAGFIDGPAAAASASAGIAAPIDPSLLTGDLSFIGPDEPIDDFDAALLDIGGLPYAKDLGGFINPSTGALSSDAIAIQGFGAQDLLSPPVLRFEDAILPRDGGFEESSNALNPFVDEFLSGGVDDAFTNAFADIADVLVAA